MRYVGARQNHICIVSDKPFKSSGDLFILEVPTELMHLSNAELITDCKIFNGKIKYKFAVIPTSELRIAFASNYAMTCGISTFAENLFPQIAKHIKDFKLFIEENDFPTEAENLFGDQILRPEQVSVCWKRNESLQHLADEIKKYEPDIILINHEWGIFPNARHWLSFLTQLSDYRIITILHSVFPDHLDKTIVEASIPHAIVHLEGAKQSLLNKGINSKIDVMPHGCYKEISNNKLWNFYKSEHTFIQMGFGFKYKNFEDSLIAVSLLKDKYPDIFFTALFSEAILNKLAHHQYYNELIDLIDKLNIKENVSIIRGFQSDRVINSYLRSNKVAVFPYKSQPNHKVYGASGSARLAMSFNIPVISSGIPHFSDLPTIKTETPQQIADELDKLFSDPKTKNEQLSKQNAYITENTWEKIALRYIKIFNES